MLQHTRRLMWRLTMPLLHQLPMCGRVLGSSNACACCQVQVPSYTQYVMLLVLP
jgi:hypothetical protein